MVGYVCVRYLRQKKGGTKWGKQWNFSKIELHGEKKCLKRWSDLSVGGEPLRHAQHKKKEKLKEQTPHRSTADADTKKGGGEGNSCTGSNYSIL